MKRSTCLLLVALVAVVGLAGHDAALADPEVRNLRFHADCLDLDTGALMSCRLPGDWDVEIDYWAPTTVHAIVRQNAERELEIALLEDRAFEDVTPADEGDASFSTEPLHVLFDGAHVVLVRTDRGAVFKLGQPSEGPGGITLTYELLAGGS